MKRIIIATLMTAVYALFQGGVLAAELPPGLTWISNTDQPVFADSNAKPGGTYRLHISSFPLTLRTIGPDSNGSFRAFLLDGNPALLQQQPNTRQYLPAIAKQWAFGDDHRTIFFELNKEARWSNGKPITSKDFSFVFDYMRSEHTKAPWYKDYFTNKIAGITVYDNYTFALHSADPLASDELLMRLNIMPKPSHFYPNGIPKDFIKRYNWKAEPVTGPYKVGKVRKGKSIQLVKTKNWWGYKNPYYQHRYNVDKIIIKVIRDTDIAIKYFEKGELDAFYMVFPSIWHEKAKGKLYDQGYIHKAWLYNKYPQGAAGIWLNLDAPHMDDTNIRRGIAHALNVQKMIDVALRGDYVRLQSFGSGYGQYDNPEIQAKIFDPDLAASYFAQAGYQQLGSDGVRVNSKGEKLTITLTYLSKMHTARVIVLKEEARKAGLNIELKLVDGATGFKSLLEKKHQAAFLGMGSAQLPVYWQYFHSSNAQPQTNNFTNYANPDMDQLINAYDSEFDIDNKASLSRQIQGMIADCDCVIPTYSVPFSRGAYWRYVKLPEGLGTELSRDILDAKSMEYGLFWIDVEDKRKTRSALKAGKTFPPVTVINKRYIQDKGAVTQ